MQRVKETFLSILIEIYRKFNKGYSCVFSLFRLLDSIADSENDLSITGHTALSNSNSGNFNKTRILQGFVSCSLFKIRLVVFLPQGVVMLILFECIFSISFFTSSAICIFILTVGNLLM